MYFHGGNFQPPSSPFQLPASGKWSAERRSISFPLIHSCSKPLSPRLIWGTFEEKSSLSPRLDTRLPESFVSASGPSAPFISCRWGRERGQLRRCDRASVLVLGAGGAGGRVSLHPAARLVFLEGGEGSFPGDVRSPAVSCVAPSAQTAGWWPCLPTLSAGMR